MTDKHRTSAPIDFVNRLGSDDYLSYNYAKVISRLDDACLGKIKKKATAEAIYYGLTGRLSADGKTPTEVPYG